MEIETCECAYCGRHVDGTTPTTESDWEIEALSHEPDCEWVLTRAHTINPLALSNISDEWHDAAGDYDVAE